MDLTIQIRIRPFKYGSDHSNSCGNSFMENPTYPEKKVHFCPDCPHCLKRLRDHLLDHGLKFPDGEGGYDEITKETFEQLIREDKNQLKMCPKIKRIHLEVYGSARLKVRLAAQLLSETTAKALSFLNDEYENVSEKLLIFDRWFDASNSRHVDEVKPLRKPFGFKENIQIKALKDMEDLMNTMKYADSESNAKKPFQKGILINIKSTLVLYEEMKEEGYSYLLTSRLNQDALESTFSRMRGVGKAINNHFVSKSVFLFLSLSDLWTILFVFILNASNFQSIIQYFHFDFIVYAKLFNRGLEKIKYFFVCFI